jgi:hypothetical protein
VFLRNATAEFAQRLVETDLTTERDGLGLNRVQVDKLRVRFDKTERRGIIPEVIRDMIRFYGTPIDDTSGSVAVTRGTVVMSFS